MLHEDCTPGPVWPCNYGDVRIAVVIMTIALAACGSATLGDPPAPDAAGGGDDDAPPDASQPHPDARICAAGDANVYDPVAGHCIAYFETLSTWLQARNVCLGLGGDLGVPTSQQENDLYWPIATNVLTEPDAWLGGTDTAAEGTFQWVTGEPFSFTHWRSGEPNNGGTSGTQEDCAVIEDDTQGTWDDRPCGEAYPYFCELP